MIPPGVLQFPWAHAVPGARGLSSVTTPWCGTIYPPLVRGR